MLCTAALAVLLTATPAPSPDSEASLDVRGFGGPILGATQLGGDLTFVTGGRGGLRFGDAWILGASIEGTPSILGRRPTLVNERVAAWRLGLVVEHVFAASAFVHPRLGIKAGGMYLELYGPDSVAERTAAFAEPTVALEFNAARVLRVAATLGYRIVAPTPQNLNPTDLNGFNVGVTLDFGAF